ncbi:MAG: beta-galactosidase trimerization domain-containing protein [bacterium]|nr:beta-galactosidase trimerization domain-containing protein [bacterium]
MVWHEQPVRMMRLDYLDDIQQIKQQDLDALAKMKKEQWHINCEWIVATPGIAPGLGYYVTFNTPKYEKYPLLGEFDLIREYLPYAKKYGIHLLAYLNMHWFSYDFAALHPGWEQMMANGIPYGKARPLYGYGTTFCVNSGWRDWAFDLIAETMKTGIEGVFLDGPVIYPDSCYCRACRTKFERVYQTPLPEQQDWFNPTWKNFIEFREQSLADFLRDARTAVKQVHPDGIIFLNAGNWLGGAWRIARDIEKVGAYQDFNGAEAFFHPGTPDPQLFFWSRLAKYLTAAKKPAVVFNHHCLGSWHYIPLPEMEMQLATAQTVANGANPWFAVYNYSLDYDAESAIRPVREINGFLEQNETYYTDTQSAADIAVLLSRQTSTYYLSQLEDIYVDSGTGREEGLVADITARKIVDWAKRKSNCDQLVGNSFLGWTTALFRSHIPFDIILDKDIEDINPEKYRVIILPNSACLSEAQIAGLKNYVANGGKLIATYETGRYDERGNLRVPCDLWTLFGIEKIEKVLPPASGEEYLKVKILEPITRSFKVNQFLPRPAYSLFLKPTETNPTPMIYMNPIGNLYHPPQGESAYPAVFITNNGKVIYFPYLIEETYARLKLADHFNLMVNSIKRACGEQVLLETDAPPTVEIELRKQLNPKRLLIHLVNNTGDMQRPINKIFPVRDMALSLQIAKPNKIYSLQTNQTIPFEMKENRVKFTVEYLEVYEVIVIE